MKNEYPEPMKEGEKNIEELFENLKPNMPLPEEMKDGILALFTYILSM